jgi:hypothetical protein
MDAVALQTLRDEMSEDCRVVFEAYQQADARFQLRDLRARGRARF